MKTSASRPHSDNGPISLVVEPLAEAPEGPCQETAGEAGAAPAQPYRSPGSSKDWGRLEPHLEALLHVVPLRSSSLERTTLLTWMYLRQGAISFAEVAELVGPGIRPTLQKKAARRALRGLHRIGAVTFAPLKGGEDELDDLDGEDPSADQAFDDDGTESVSITPNTGCYITAQGMTWMRRAWHARHISLQGKEGNLARVHQMYLDEEEEGKGNEPYWIESLGTGDISNGERRATGEVTSWIGSPIASVFDLPIVTTSRKRVG